MSLSFPRVKYESTATFTTTCCPGKCKNMHWEAILIIVFCIIGVIGEMATAFHHHETGYLLYYGNIEHATMFFFFGLAAVFDLMLHSKLSLPPDMDYVMLCLAFSVEGLLFYFHLSGRSEVDVQVHKLLILTIFGNIISTLMELKYRTNVVLALTRALCLILQGTWFFQIAFVLYSPYDTEDNWEMVRTQPATKFEIEHLHDELMFVTCAYAWHAGSIILTMFLIGTVFRCYYKCRKGSELYDIIDTHQLINYDTNGHRFISLPEGDADDDDASGSDEN